MVLRAKNFVLVDPIRYAAFEMIPSLKNIIVLMNYLLGLELYKNIETQFFNPDFNATYFPKLIAAFDWEIDEDEDDLKMFDTLDYTKEIKILVTTKEGGSFELMISPGHGEIKVFDKEKVELYQSELVHFIKNVYGESDTAYTTMLTLYALYNFGDSISDNPLLLSPATKAFLYYAQKLKVSHIKEIIINDILQRQDQSLYDLVAGLIKSLDPEFDYMILAQIIRDNEWQQVMGKKGQNKKIATTLSQIADHALSDSSATYLFQEFIGKDLFIEKAIKAAHEKIKSNSQDEKEIALVLFDVLVNKGLEYEAAFAAAQIGIQSKENMQIAEAISIFSGLVCRDLYLDQAVMASSIASLSNDDMVQNRLLNLQSELIQRDKALEDAVAVASAVMQQDFELLQEQALNNFRLLLYQNKGLQEAFAAAKIGITGNEESTRKTALTLFDAFAHNIKIEKLTAKEATEYAKILLEIMQSDTSNNDRCLGILHSFARLVNLGYGYKEALIAADLAMKNTDPAWSALLHHEGLELKNKLLSKSGEFKIEIIKDSNISLEQILKKKIENLDERLKK